MNKTLFLLGLILSSLGMAQERGRSCTSKRMCTKEYNPTHCWVKDAEHLEAIGSNPCEANSNLAFKLCQAELDKEPVDIVCESTLFSQQ